MVSIGPHRFYKLEGLEKILSTGLNSEHSAIVAWLESPGIATVKTQMSCRIASRAIARSRPADVPERRRNKS